MTYVPHLLLQFGGSLFSADQWSCSLRIALGGEGSIVPVGTGILNDWARENIDDLAADVAAWMADPESKNSTAARLEYVKCNAIAENGRYASQEETILVEFSGTDRPVGTRTQGPGQNTLCVSLLTSLSRGRASRGRFFPPTGAMNIDANTGKVSASDAAGVAVGAQTLLDAIANEPGIDLQSPRVVVASDLGSPGPVRSVTRVAVGDVLDTQRRRRESLDEVYVEYPITIT